MPLAYTTEQLIEEVRNRSFTPDTTSEGTTDDDLILYLNGEMLNEIIPQVSRLQEEFMIVTEVVSLPGSGQTVKVPSRAVGNSLRDVTLVSDGDRLQLPHINREHLPQFEIERRGTDDTVRGYFLENQRIRFVGTASSSFDLEVAYRFRPSQLVLSTSYRQVTNVSGLTVTLSGTDIPTEFVTGALVDIHGDESGSEIKTWDNAIANVSGQVLTLTDAIDGTDTREGRPAVEVNDYVCPAEQCAIPMLPRETHQILVQAAVCRLIEALDDQEKLAMHTHTLNRWLKNMEYNMGKRVEGRPRKIVAAHAPIWRMGNVQRRSI